MEKLTVQDFELIQVAQEAIKGKYDGIGFLHTVGAALRTKQGRITTGESMSIPSMAPVPSKSPWALP